MSAYVCSLSSHVHSSKQHVHVTRPRATSEIRATAVNVGVACSENGNNTTSFIVVWKSRIGRKKWMWQSLNQWGLSMAMGDGRDVCGRRQSGSSGSSGSSGCVRPSSSSPTSRVLYNYANVYEYTNMHTSKPSKTYRARIMLKTTISYYHDVISSFAPKSPQLLHSAYRYVNASSDVRSSYTAAAAAAVASSASSMRDLG